MGVEVENFSLGETSGAVKGEELDLYTIGT